MDDLDLMTDEQLYALRHTLIARATRIRGLVLAKRVERGVYDKLVSEQDAVNGEIERRGLPLDEPRAERPF